MRSGENPNGCTLFLLLFFVGGGFGWVLGYSAFGPWFAGNDSVQLCFYKAMMIYGLVLLIALLLAFFAAIAG